jgi:predicted amidohydrolase
MRVAFVQFNPQFGRISDNIEKATSLMVSIDADLIVLPELSFSGYVFTSRDEASSMAESVPDGFTMKRMAELSARLDCGIIYGFPEYHKGNLYNSCAFVSPGSEIEVYRKLHLYYYEKDWFEAGDKPLNVFEFRGCRIGMMICYDWIYPEVARTLALRGAHLICHPANLVMSHCQNAMITRCLENRIFTLTANRIGREARGEFDFEFTGESQILSPEGKILYRASKDKEEYGVADIDTRASENKVMNLKNDLWKDRRAEFYGILERGNEKL